MDTIYAHEVIPGVLEKDWAEIEKRLDVIKTFSSEVHIDFIDNTFSQKETFLDPSPFIKYKDLHLEAHLQVEEPISYLDGLSKAGFRKFIGNIEKMKNQAEFIAEAELFGEVGLGLNLNTSVGNIEVPFDDLDFVHLMTISANETGLKFDQSSLAKIKELRSKTTIPIEVDGGINDQTIIQCRDSGANIFVATSFIAGSNNPAGQYSKLKNLLA